MAFARCLILVHPSGFFLKGVHFALLEPEACSLCLAAQSWVGDPVGRIIFCNPQLCDLTRAQRRARWVGEAKRGADSWRGIKGCGSGQSRTQGAQGH